MSDTVLIDGTDLNTSKRVLETVDGLVDTPEFRGSNIVIPYAHGELRTDKYRAPKPVTLFMTVIGDDRDDLNAELATLFALLPVGGAGSVDTSCTLTRRLTSGDVTATAEYIGGASPVYASERHARLTLRFLLLDGDWESSSSSSSSS